MRIASKTTTAGDSQDVAACVPSQMADILLASLKELAAAGQVETACRLAGQACAALRNDAPDAWAAFNAFLHRFARRTADP
jgi:hypothetical protein